MRLRKPPTISLKLMAMVMAVRKKMKKMIMVGVVCCWHLNSGEKKRIRELRYFVEGVVAIDPPLRAGVAYSWPHTLATLLIDLSNPCRINSLDFSCSRII